VVDVFEVAELLVAHVRNDPAVAIVTYYGSHARGNASPSSDLDILFVADDPAATTKARTFILDGLPYDFWPVSWRFLEDIAEARGERPWEVAASLVLDARVLHARSAADRDRFEAIQERARLLTTPAGRPAAIARAAGSLSGVVLHFGRVQLAAAGGDAPGLRLAAWQLLQASLTTLALVNQTPFSKGRGADLAEALELPMQPPRLAELVDRLTGTASPSVVEVAALDLVQGMRSLVAAAAATVGQEDPEALAGEYPGVVEYRLKVESACDRGDVAAAAGAALIIQDELARTMHVAASGAYPADSALLGDYSAAYSEAGFPDLSAAAAEGDLDELRRLVQVLDAGVRSWMTRRGLSLDVVADLDTLRRLLAASDAP
jgi:predicted nucleotidyltransferase